MGGRQQRMETVWWLYSENCVAEQQWQDSLQKRLNPASPCQSCLTLFYHLCQVACQSNCSQNEGDCI